MRASTFVSILFAAAAAFPALAALAAPAYAHAAGRLFAREGGKYVSKRVSTRQDAQDDSDAEFLSILNQLASPSAGLNARDVFPSVETRSDLSTSRQRRELAELLARQHVDEESGAGFLGFLRKLSSSVLSVFGGGGGGGSSSEHASVPPQRRREVVELLARQQIDDTSAAIVADYLNSLVNPSLPRAIKARRQEQQKRKVTHAYARELAKVARRLDELD